MDNTVKDRFVQLRAEGKSFAAIAGELGVGKSTLIGWSRELKEDIANMRQVHLEAIREKYRLHQERRLELFGKQLDAVEGELAKRPLENVPTERLFDIMVKLTRELAQDVAAPTFQRRENPLQTDILDICSVSTWQA